jgi:hypothetical protein
MCGVAGEPVGTRQASNTLSGARARDTRDKHVIVMLLVLGFWRRVLFAGCAVVRSVPCAVDVAPNPSTPPPCTGCSFCAGTSLFGACFMFLLGVLIKHNYQCAAAHSYAPHCALPSMCRQSWRCAAAHQPLHQQASIKLETLPLRLF